MSDVLTSVANGLARITLNRPEALHALTTHMCANMTQALLAWRDDDSVRAVMIDHKDGTRGFCAGGDIRLLADSGKTDGRVAREFFFTEYRLNHLLFTYPKPIVAIMDGVTMGGGVGISMPAKFRIATERTTYAMPETGIGLFPDVGGGWYLPRKPGQVGMWLALTGARLKAADCLAAGIATHYLPSEILAPARAQIAGAAQTHDVERALQSGLDALAEEPGAAKELTLENRQRIDRIFSLASVEAIIAALEADGSEWSKAQLRTLATKSPQTLKVSFRQLREGARMPSFADEMAAEYAIACRVAVRPDFAEGVRALIVDKDNAPLWRPPTLAGVTDTMLDEIFAPMPSGEEWTPLV
jgi:enoyl-CoA hydratase/carnithine racemase